MLHAYDDEDNVPMNDENFDPIDRDGHNPTVYTSWAEMKAEEAGLPFTDEPEKGCWNCLEFDGDRCMKDWNNADEDYYIPDRDDHDPTDYCDDWELNEDVMREDYF